MKSGINRQPYLRTLFWVFAGIWILLAIDPVSRSDWFLENILIFLGVPLVLYVNRHFRLSLLSFTLIFIFCVCTQSGLIIPIQKYHLGNGFQNNWDSSATTMIALYTFYGDSCLLFRFLRYCANG